MGAMSSRAMSIPATIRPAAGCTERRVVYAVLPERGWIEAALR